MGEVNNMKKVISVVMCAVMLLCCACFAGCSSQDNDIIQTFHNNGYKDAYINADSEIFKDVPEWSEIYLHQNNDNEDIYSVEAIWVNESDYSIVIRKIKQESDLIKILDIMLNYYYNQSGYGQKIVDDVYNKFENKELEGTIDYGDFFIGFKIDDANNKIDHISLQKSKSSSVN